jgi:hypothetical protein
VLRDGADQFASGGSSCILGIHHVVDPIPGKRGNWELEAEGLWNGLGGLIVDLRATDVRRSGERCDTGSVGDV